MKDGLNLKRDTPATQFDNDVVDNNFDRLAYWSGRYTGPKTWEQQEITIRNGQLLIANKTTTADPDTSSDDWDYLAFTPNVSYLGGAPANFSPGSSYTAVTNWPDSLAIGEFADPNTTTGVITLPRAAEYKVNAQIIFQQGNTNKELAILLWVRSSVAGDFVLSALQVSDDKTNWRSLGASFGYAGVAGETLQLGLSVVNQSIGTASFQPCTFDVDMIIPADITELGDT